MARYRKYQPRDDYAGSPTRTHTDIIGKGISRTINQWPSLSYEILLEIPVSRLTVSIDQLNLYGWQPQVQGDMVQVKHRSEEPDTNGWSAMMLRKFVA